MISPGDPLVRPQIFRTYWAFAAERHRIFLARRDGAAPPWTEDQILRDYRFCNAFRASDRVSQYLIRDVIYARPELDFPDLFVRTVLFRLFSRESTWELIEDSVDGLTLKSFQVGRIARALDAAFARRQPLYTSAFILCANRAFGHKRKHRNHLALVERMVADGLPDQLIQADGLGQAYRLLLEYPLIGPFMAYQLAIDLNYGPHLHWSEDEFTIPGPGAVRGLKKVFADLGGLSPAEAILWLVDQQHRVSEALGLEAPDLFGRPLHAIDCQNLLCEVDKYCRVAFPELESNRVRIKRRFAPASDKFPLFYPPKWGINERIGAPCP